MFSAVMCFFTQSQAADRYWVGTSGGTWENTSNWSATLGGAGGVSVPASNDNVYIPLTANVTIPVTSSTIFPTSPAGFNILAISGAFTLTFTYNSTTTKTINMNSTSTGGFSIASGTTVRLLGTTFTAGTGYTNGRLNIGISGGGTTTNNIDGKLDIAGASAQLTLGSSTTLNISGRIRHFAGSGNISTSGTIKTTSSAELEWYRNGGSVPAATYDPASTIRYFGGHTFDGTTITPITSTTSGLAFGGVSPYNWPNFEVNIPNASGTLNWTLPSNFTINGNMNVIAYTGGTILFSNTLTNFIVNGNFTSNANINLSNPSTTPNTMTVNGNISITAGTLNLSTGTSKKLSKA